MGLWLWLPALLLGIWASHWGADQLAEPLKKLRQQWGLSEAGEATFAGIAAASPEVAMAAVSAWRGVASIGVGATVGTNIIAIPLSVSLAYLATHWYGRRRKRNPEEVEPAGKEEAAQPAGELRIQPEAATVQAIPYLGLVALLAVLTLPQRWRGLQPVDGWILVGAYGLYLGQALFRKRNSKEPVSWSKPEIFMAMAGFLVLAVGAYAAIWATENISKALGLPHVIGGLFIAAPMACLPELFESWSLVRSGQLNSAVMSVIGDHAVTLTLAFLPLALVATPIEEFRLFWFSLIFVGLMPLLYAQFSYRPQANSGFKLWHVLVLDAVFLFWIGAFIFGRAWLLD